MTIVQDNLTAHKPGALYEILPPARARQILRRIEFVHTPKHGSWLNVAEIELGLLKRIGLAARVDSREELERQVAKIRESEKYQRSENRLAIHDGGCESQIEEAVSVNSTLTEH